MQISKAAFPYLLFIHLQLRFFFFLQDGAKAQIPNTSEFQIGRIEVDRVPVTSRKHKIEASVVVVLASLAKTGLQTSGQFARGRDVTCAHVEAVQQIQCDEFEQDTRQVWAFFRVFWCSFYIFSELKSQLQACF